MGSFRKLIVYQIAFKLAMDIFKLTKEFPPEEKYDLIHQIRKSSRSVCPAIAEGYRKRQYPAYFVAKISDADMENSETQVWLDFSLSCKYLLKDIYMELLESSEEVGKIFNHMIENPDKFK